MAQPATPLHAVSSAPLYSARPTTSVVNITPQLAEAWLEHNTGNRKYKNQEIDRYARDMAAGRWKLTGESIKFSTELRLLDGQNRLAAVMKSGCTVPMFVTRGLDDDSQRVMDTGAKRTSADDLGMHGEKHSSTLAAACRLAIAADSVGMERQSGFSVSNLEIVDFLEENPEIRVAVSVARDVARQMDAYPTVVAYAYWKLSAIDPWEAASFFESAATKVGLLEGDPILAMTKRFAEARRNRERLPHAVQLSVIYRVWNARREGKTMRFVRVRSPKSGDVPIPEPK